MLELTDMPSTYMTWLMVCSLLWVHSGIWGGSGTAFGLAL